MGSTGFDDKFRCNISMRGVVSSTSNNKLSLYIIGNNQVALAA
jgi:hypothetical protein